MYEHKSQAPLKQTHFVRRLLWHSAVALAVLLVSLGVGMTGYVVLEGLTWLDGFLNAAMLLGGMGPIHAPFTPGGKLFAGLYALYAGLVFIVTAALLFTPIVHRLLHKFHWGERL